MNKLLLVLIAFGIQLGMAQAQIDIADARTMSIGETVTIEGIATNGEELSIIRYIQDATAGIAVFPGTGSTGNFPDDVKRGDRVRVTGPLKEFNGLLEVDPVMSYTVISSNNPLPDPLIGTPNDLNEENEGKLMTIEDVEFVNQGGVFGVGTLSFSSNGESSQIFVRSGHSLIGTEIPLASVNLTGLCSEFNGAYQLILRDINDIEVASDFFINVSPTQSDLTTEGFTVKWETNVPGSSNIRYGLTSSLDEVINLTGSTTNHSVVLTGLEPGEFYYVQAFSNDGNTEVSSNVQIYSTASNSTGTIRTYFTDKVDGNFSTGSHPVGVTPLSVENAIINLINSATTSIDVSVFNNNSCLLYTSPSPRDLSTSRMPSSA